MLGPGWSLKSSDVEVCEAPVECGGDFDCFGKCDLSDRSARCTVCLGEFVRDSWSGWGCLGRYTERMVTVS